MRLAIVFVCLFVGLALVACLPQTSAFGASPRDTHNRNKLLRRRGAKAAAALAAPAPAPLPVPKGSTATPTPVASTPKKTESTVSQKIIDAYPLKDFKTEKDKVANIVKSTSTVDQAAVRKLYGADVATSVLDKAALEFANDAKYITAVIPLTATTSQLFIATEKSPDDALTAVKAVITKHSIPPNQIELYYRGTEHKRLSTRRFADKLGAAGTEMRGGQSAGAKEEDLGLGTMGAFLIDANKRLWGLSNNHVFGTATGVTVCQPAVQALYMINYDECVKAGTAAATCEANAKAKSFPCDELGTVSYASATKDIALSTVSSGNNAKCAIHKGSAGTPVPITGSVTAAVGDSLWKYGSRTHFTDGGVVVKIDSSSAKMSIKATSVPKFSDTTLESKGLGDVDLYKSPANEPNFWLSTIAVDNDAVNVRGFVKDFALRVHKKTLTDDEIREVVVQMVFKQQIQVFSARGDSGSAIMKDSKVAGLLIGGEWLKKECKLFDGWIGSITKQGIDFCGISDLTYAIPIADVLSDINSNTVFGTATTFSAPTVAKPTGTAGHDGKIKQPVAVCQATDESSVVGPA